MQKKINKNINIREEKLKANARKISIKEGSAYSINEGLGMKYITPYALELNANNSEIGFLSSIPQMLGNLSQIYTTKSMENNSRKNILFVGAFLQAMMWIPIIAVGILFFFFDLNASLSVTLLIIAYTMFVTFGAFITPAWNSWMKDIVTEESGRYFGLRSRICTLVALVTMLLGGFILDYFKQTKVFYGFLILFGMAFLFRSISAFLFRKKYEPKLKLDKDYHFTFWQFLKKIPKSNFGKFVVFVSLMSLATAIASPFFAVYMLKDLGFNYTMWITTIISASIASLIFLPVWGKFIDNYGTVRIMKITGLFIPIIPILWLLSPMMLKINTGLLFAYLILVEGFSGFMWAGFNLAIGNFIYDAVTRQRLALCTAYFNVVNSIGVFIGASLGGAISLWGSDLIGMNSLLFVFLLSGFMRLFIYASMSAKIKEVREIKRFKLKEIKNKFLSLTFKEMLEYFEIRL